MRHRISLIVLGVALAIGWGIAERRRLFVYMAALEDVPGLLEPIDQGPGARWADDYYTIERVDERTFAIGEPRYPQQNYNYLILGSKRAVLFDAGPGIRDIRPVAKMLTDLPITFVPSHFHYDHVGGDFTFERVAIIDLPHVRARIANDALTLTAMEHLGIVEGYERRTFHVSEWLTPGASMSLGDRRLRVLHTPGHTPDSISLFDEESGVVFSGDFIHPGSLYGFLPNSSMKEYVDGAETMLGAIPEDVRILGAHRVEAPGLPELAFDDVKDLRETLEAVRQRYQDGEGSYPRSFVVNERVTLLAEPRWLQRW
jgi:glyoxylase-like metal-dependent hydrolase (beta-lactamase superfamily II)